MKNREPGGMPPGDFREWAHRATDWASDYLERVGEYPVLADVAPGEVRSRLPRTAPEHGESVEDLLRDFESVVMPGITIGTTRRSSPISRCRARVPASSGSCLRRH